MMNLLLVDDESYVTESLFQTIPWRELDIGQVYQASSALEAIDLLEEQDIDVVVTDIRMPVMTGLELIETIAGRWTHIRCILLTGYSDFEYAKQAIRLDASDYILKPVDDGEFMRSVQSALESIREERKELGEYQQLRYSRKSDIGILRTSLMHDLLLGHEMPRHVIDHKLREYEIPLGTDQRTIMLLIQLGPKFTGMDDHSISLMEYAIGNIAEEVFAELFRVWPSKTPHSGMILLAQLKTELLSEGTDGPAASDVIKRYVTQFQQDVGSYLKGGISVLVSASFDFPSELAGVYRTGLSSLYIGGSGDHEAIRFAADNDGSRRDSASHATHSFMKPPSLLHLLETRQWDSAREKIEQLFVELETAFIGQSALYEIFLSVTNAYMYMAHKQGYYIHQLDQAGWDPLYIQQVVQSAAKLRSWSLDMLNKLQAISSEQETTSKSHIIKQVQEMVTTDCGHDLSVKTIADRVYLHPVYLSKIYKSETGEGLGDYIIRKRMERAVYLLKHTNKKIYEITAELGYQNPQYFSKMFRKHYGMTPNEYRDQGCC